jgi:hypothetical protein
LVNLVCLIADEALSYRHFSKNDSAKTKFSGIKIYYDLVFNNATLS